MCHMPCAMTFMLQENFIFDILEPHAFKQAPEAGGCAIGDGGDREQKGTQGTHMTQGTQRTQSTVLRHGLTEIKPTMGEISNF